MEAVLYVWALTVAEKCSVLLTNMISTLTLFALHAYASMHVCTFHADWSIGHIPIVQMHAM